MRNTQEHDWRTIGALNVASALAQVGQFGFAYVVLPVWLAEQGLGAAQLGLFAASLWLGQLPGLALAPSLSRRFGPRQVITAGLLCTVTALAWIALTSWPGWLLGGTLAGFGLGLRWIGLEPWLYRIAPADARGRLVGFHESLIALAPVIAPWLAGRVGLQGAAIFWIGAVFTLGAMVPLAFARDAPLPTAFPAHDVVSSPSKPPRFEHVLMLGVVIALLGGMMEAAVSGLFALYAEGRGISVRQTTSLLTAFGLGGLLMQYAAGWLADHRGVGTAALYCAIGCAVVALALGLPLNEGVIVAAVFLLGGFITSFLTLALIASTMTVSGTLARNVSLICMLYTGSAIAGPLIAGAIMNVMHTDALMWFTAAASVVMACALGASMSVNRTRIT